MQQCFLGGAFFRFPAPAIAFRKLEQLLTLFVGDCSSFDSWHGGRWLDGVADFLEWVVESQRLSLAADVFGGLAGLEMVEPHRSADYLAVLRDADALGETLLERHRSVVIA